MNKTDKPRAFLSYSWGSQAHQQFVLKCAERLMADGVDVVLDVYDLKEGHDKHHFMERMVSDKKVTHVLLFCDRSYAEKANSRKAGVGTESQIISKEIYSSVDQEKFIPLACEFAENGEAYLPAFLSSRIWIDFSSQEAVNKNWERLVRVLFGKPQYVKPEVGSPPSYILSDATIPSNPAGGKFAVFRQALLDERKNLAFYRTDFLNACYAFVEGFRVRTPPSRDINWGEKVLADCNALLPARDLIIDWILLEAPLKSSAFNESVIEMLEKLRELRSRPNEVNSWSDVWFEPLKLFTYEVFLYTVASLLKTKAYECLHEVFTTSYPVPDSERYGKKTFDRFDSFYAYSEVLNPVLSPPDQKLYSPAAELLKRHATRTDIPFGEILQADLLSLLMALIQSDLRWYPQTMHYSSFARSFPLFDRAAQHKHFIGLSEITGVESADRLREEVKKGHQRLQTDRWHNFHFDRSFWDSMNMDRLDTIK